MKLSKLFLTAVAALTLTAGSAFGQVNTFPTSPLTLDPALSQIGFATFAVCPPPSCTNANLSGPSSYTVTFTHNGFFSSSITGTVTDTTNPTPNNEFVTLNYTIFNPAAVAVVSNVTSQNNLAVVAGTYTIQVNWHFLGTAGSNSASWTMTDNTGPALLVPEPGTLALLGLGLAVLGFSQRKKT